MFFLFRRIGNSQPPQLMWGILGLLFALGIGLIIFGLIDHNTYLVVRGAIELVIVAVIGASVVRSRRRSTGGGSNRPL